MRIWIAILAAGAMYGQQSVNNLQITPTPTFSATGAISFFDRTQTFSVRLAAPNALTANVSFRLPAADGVAGYVMKTDGAGNLSFGSADGALSAPITISGTTAPSILTVTQLGAGPALTVNGVSNLSDLAISGNASVAGILTAGTLSVSALNLTGNLTVGGITALNNDVIVSTTSAGSNSVTITQAGSAGALQVNGAQEINLNSPHAGLAIVQGGAGFGLTVDGGVSITDNSSTNNSLTVIQTGSGNALGVGGNVFVNGAISVTAGTQAPAVTQQAGNWFITGIGVGYFKDLATRFAVNSLGDQPAIGTVTNVGGVLTLTSGVPFDLSMQGGTVYLCATTCNTNITNGTGYLVGSSGVGFIDYQHIRLLSFPGDGNYAYVYQANAFQTSQGTMQITGAGAGLFQNVVVTNGFTTLGGVSRAGTVNTSGTAVVWTSGSAFDPSMQGGTITIAGFRFIVSSVQTPGLLTLTVSAGTRSGAAYSYISTALQVQGGLASITSTGFGTFAGLDINSGFSTPARLTMNGGFGGAALLEWADTLFSNCWFMTGGSSLVLTKNTSNCTTPGLPFSQTGALVTFTATGTTFSQPITVPSCTGCGGGGGGTVTGGDGITVSGSTVSLSPSGAGTAWLNYAAGPGVQVYYYVPGAGAMPGTYSNKVAAYDASGAFIGFVPLL